MSARHASRPWPNFPNEFSAHIVEGTDPIALVMTEDGPVAPKVTWWHRTAAIHGENLAVAGRSPLWCRDLLIGRELTFVRSVSFHLHPCTRPDRRGAVTTCARRRCLHSSGTPALGC